MLDEVGRPDEEKKSSRFFAIGSSVFILVMGIFYACALTYEEPEGAGLDVQMYYSYFRDVSVMIFLGFGFLMSFVRRGGFSAVGYTLFTSVMAIVFSIPLEVLFEGERSKKVDDKYTFGVLHMLHGLFCAASVMISYGAVLGRVTPVQMFILGILEPFWYWLNLFIGEKVIGTVDIGGGIFIHTFGCYFGLTMSRLVANTKQSHHPDERSCYTSDLLSLLGTLLLWVMWPSFNAAIASPDGQNRAIINTFLSLSGATIATFIASQFLHAGKFDPVMIQNSTLAGGVAMGVVADVRMAPASAMGVGFLSGLVSVFGFHYLTPKLYSKFNIQDVCGIHNLHGMPGLIGSVLSIFTTFLIDLEYPHEDRQPFFQFLAILCTLIVAVIGGLITGFVMRWSERFQSVTLEEMFNDSKFWLVPSDYHKVVRGESIGH